MIKKKVFKGRITFNISSDHPDIQYVKNPNDELHFEDTYLFDSDYNKEDIINFIKNDLSIVAGGGYSTENILNVKFDIKQVSS